jgi:bleomycin hydrolase
MVGKYGIIPETVVPESFSSSASAGLNKILTAKLREIASNLRSNPDRELKEAYMAEVFNLLSVVLGTPPKPDEQVRWEYNDRDGQAMRWEGSPLDFFHQYGRREGFDPEQCFSLVNDPRHPYGKVYQVERLGNVWGSNPVRRELDQAMSYVKKELMTEMSTHPSLRLRTRSSLQSAPIHPSSSVVTALSHPQGRWAFSIQNCTICRLHSGSAPIFPKPTACAWASLDRRTRW